MESLDYKDSKSKVIEIEYDKAIRLYESGDYDTAISILENLDYKDSQNKALEIKRNNFMQLLQEAKNGDIVCIGSYEQDGYSTNGTEIIEWLVLDKKDNQVLLISKYASDCKPYNDTLESITWEKCTLRKWLNNGFYNSAFNDKEKQSIATTYVIAEKNPKYDTNPGNNTNDKIFLLSIQEANKYFNSDNARICTNFAIQNKACSWWLRSPGRTSADVVWVNDDGGINYLGIDVFESFTVNVRPALWINLESSNY